MAVKDGEEHPRRIGQYEILGALGKGAMGQVYKAVQPSLNRVVAIKVLPEEFAEDETRVERFNREAQAVALLNHPNIVQIIDKDADDEQLYFVMEYVPGSSLDAVLRQRRLSLQEAITVFKGICSGLEAAHRQTIVHRDLNPRNILVSDDLSVVKLADFGISRVESVSREMGTLSTAEASLGTLHYMAPEQAQSMSGVDHRADIYSAGVVLYEMLTGRVPVGRFNLPSQLNSEVPPELDPLVLKCLSTEPEDRYPTVHHLIKALGLLEDQLRLGLVSDLRGLSRSTSRIFRSSTTALARNRKLLYGAAGTVAAFLIVVLAVVLWPSGGGREIEIAPAPGFGEPADDGEIAEERLAAVAVPEPGEAVPRGKASPPPAPAAASPGTEAAPPPTRSAEPAPEPAPRAAPKIGREDFQVASDKLEAELWAPARADFQAFIERYPESPLLPGAYLGVAEAWGGEREVERALAAFVEVRSRFPDSEEAVQAAFRQGELLMLTSRAEKEREAREIFDRLAREHPDTDWAPRALAAKAALESAAEIRVRDPVVEEVVPAALVTLRDLVELYPRDPLCEQALQRLAAMYEDIKRFDLAAAAWVDLGARFPDSRHDAWWEAAVLYDRKLDDRNRALATYANVPESSPHYRDAQKRLARLRR